MRDHFGELKKNYSGNQMELALMFLFICLFLMICGPSIEEELTEPASAPAVLETEMETEAGTEGAAERETESEAETETENWTEAETEGQEDRELCLRRAVLAQGPDFRIPMALRETAGGALRTLEDVRMLREYAYLEDRVREKLGDLRSFAALEEELKGRLAQYDGEWSVYVKNLSTEESFVLNDRPMKSASVMKLFIMGAVYQAFEEGELERTDEVMALMREMISFSDNEASNELLYRLGEGSYERGIGKVDAFIAGHGFSEMTVEYNGFDDPATVTGSGNFNQVSAKDCGKLLEDIYRRTWVSRRVSNEMEEMLLNQHTRYKIPAGLPEGVLCGNKSGEMDTTENDAAIIYGEECDYILVVLSSNWGSKDEAIARIQTISELTYRALN